MEKIAVPEIPGLCLMAYRGSIAHNMYVPKDEPNSTDDVDMMGIVLAPVECYLGLDEWGSRGTKEVKDGPLDLVCYEIRKAVRLLLQGNPNILGLLWTRTDHFTRMNQTGLKLLQARKLFVGKHVYNAFAGYAHGQFEKMTSRNPRELREYIAVTNELKYRGSHPNHKGEAFERPYKLPYGDPASHAINSDDFELMSAANDRVVRAVSEEALWAFHAGADELIAALHKFQKKGENIGYMGDKRKQLVLERGYDTKNAAHLIRLLRMCCEFLDTGELQVYRERDREELLSIKQGKWELARVKFLAEELFERAKTARDKSHLPEGPDRKAVENVLIEILHEHITA